ncbi:hypothetical protein MNBD_GAMMA03-80 [hydrothermal vent metagenome]|uniref:Uncharacterized protein n=1 Tax=hydrothermal vent metagenome TaxID=652676 RepID=A0A3B0W0W9_9ZZZZ
MNNNNLNSTRIKAAIATTAVKIFSPLVRILLRNGVAYKTAAKWLRWTYAEVARKELKLPG